MCVCVCESASVTLVCVMCVLCVVVCVCVCVSASVTYVCVVCGYVCVRVYECDCDYTQS